MPRRLRPLLLLAAALLPACAPAATRSTPRIDSAEGLVRAMHDRWSDRWYRTLTFTQQTTRVLPNDSVVVEEWREWAAIPGHLRIEIGPREAGRGVIFTRDSTFTIRDGRLARATPTSNELMTLGFDVYRQPVETTLDQLRRHGFDLSKFHADTLDGVPVYVVGAERGDGRTKQFAIEADRLLFVRIAQGTGDTDTQEIWFRRYQPLAGAWIAPEVEILIEGRRVFHEVYSDIRANVPIDPAMFDPRAWR